MKIAFVTIGRYKSKELETLVAHYLKLAGKFATIETVELAPARGASEEEGQTAALLKWLEKRGNRFFLMLLDERGKAFTSRDFAGQIEKVRNGSYSEWIIAVGGAHGYRDELRVKAQLLWSLSPLTFTHELATAVAAEQLFRGLAILNNHPYHND